MSDHHSRCWYADDQVSFRAGNNVYGVARMQKPQHVMEFDLGRMEAHNFSANTPELPPILFAPMPRQSTTIPASGSRFLPEIPNDTPRPLLRERWQPLPRIRDCRLTLPQEYITPGKIVFPGQVPSLQLRTFQTFKADCAKRSISFAHGGLSGILAMPEQDVPASR